MESVMALFMYYHFTELTKIAELKMKAELQKKKNNNNNNENIMQ